MGGCLSTEELSPRNHLIIDVQQIIADDAWEEFVVSSRRNCKRLRMKRSDYVIDVPMNYYHFEVIEAPEYTPIKRLPTSDSVRKGQGQSSHALTDRASPDQLGLKTEFRNDTNENQTYNFRMEKMRTATVQVSYQKGFSIGGNASFTLGLPKVLAGGELSGEVNTTYEITSSRGQTFEETLTTEATSEIVVTKNSHCTAQVVMEERRLLANFKVNVLMHMPQKAAVVNIKNKKGRVVFLKEIVNLSMLFPPHTHLTDEQDRNKTREDAVKFVVHGFVDGMQLSNHYIHLKSREIPPGGAKPRTRRTPKDDKRDDNVDDLDNNDENQFEDLKDMGFKPGMKF